MSNTKDRLTQREEIVRRLNGIDDTFFHKLAESREVLEEILRIMLNDPSISLTIAIAQKFLRNCGSRSVSLDAYGVDRRERYYCMEMEKSDKHDHQKRVRYNLSNVDTLVTETGTEFKDLPEIYAVYVTKKDFLNGGKTKYTTPRILDSSKEILHNGLHEIYVNAQIDDGSVCAELMQYLKKTDPLEDHPAFLKTVARVRYFKLKKKGVRIMCKLVEDYAQEVAAEAAENAAKTEAEGNVINMFRNGASLAFVRACIQRFSEEELLWLRSEALR